LSLAAPRRGAGPTLFPLEDEFSGVIYSQTADMALGHSDVDGLDVMDGDEAADEYRAQRNVEAILDTLHQRIAGRQVVLSNLQAELNSVKEALSRLKARQPGR
jgi:hypothetical protein